MVGQQVGMSGLGWKLEGEWGREEERGDGEMERKRNGTACWAEDAVFDEESQSRVTGEGRRGRIVTGRGENGGDGTLMNPETWKVQRDSSDMGLW